MTIEFFDRLIFALLSYISLVFGVVLIFFKGEDNRSKRFLSIYMFLNFIYYTISFLYYADFFKPVVYLYFIVVPVIALIQPFFYLYVSSLTTKNFRWNWKHTLHFLLFVFFLLLNLFSYSFLNYNEKLMLLNYVGESVNTRNNILNFYFFLHDTGYNIILSLQALIYSILLFRLYFNHRKRMKYNFSFSEEINLNWLIFLLMFFIVLSFVNEFFGNVDRLIVDPQARISYNLPILLIVTLIGVFGIKQKEIYPAFIAGQRETLQPYTQEIDEESDKYKNSSLKDELKEKLTTNITQLMEKKKPYLQHTFSLDELTRLLGSNRQYVSQILNDKFQQNFYNFTNELRIKEAIRLLKLGYYKDLSILGIAKTVGFLSKSSFYKAFKKSTGKTPLEFIDEIEK